MSVQLQKNEILHKGYYTVLVFDSGVGGLSIYETLRTLLPNFNYIYAFDNDAFPYGEKSEEFIIKRIIKVITAVKKRRHLHFAVIGCSTASTIAINALHKVFQFPIIGVIPAIQSAADLTRNKIIGLIATHGTVACSYTHKLIKKFSSNFHIKILGSVELAKLAEEKIRGKIISLKPIQQIMQPWLQMSEPPDTVVLGCTHFILLKNEILSVLPKGTLLIDSRNDFIRHAAKWLLKNKIINKQSKGLNCAYCTEFNLETKQLMPVLHQYNLRTLEKLEL